MVSIAFFTLQLHVGESRGEKIITILLHNVSECVFQHFKLAVITCLENYSARGLITLLSAGRVFF